MNNRYEIFAVNIPKEQGTEKAEGCFRVMTWNVNGKLDEDPDTVKKELIDVLDKYEPDIVCFQEMMTQTFNQIQTTLDSIFGYSDSQIIKNNRHRYRIYSKKPIRNFQQYKCVTCFDPTGLDSLQLNEIKLLKEQMPVYSAEIEVEPDKWITVFAVHLRSSAYSTARRSMEEGSSWRDGIPLYLENFKIGAKIRNYEADNLRIFLDSLEAKHTPIIIAGDFNDWSGSSCMKTIRNSYYLDAWWEKGDGLGITYEDWNLKLRLDHILYNNLFNLVNVFVVKYQYSDHYPLIGEFKLRIE